MACKLRLDGGVAFVTGAGSGIGRETANAFADAGAKAVVFADLDEASAAQAAEESRQFAKHAYYLPLPMQVDVASELSVQNAVDESVRRFGRIDYGVNNAGLGNLSTKTTHDLDVEIFSKTIDTNVKGTMLCLRALSKTMKKQEPRYYNGRHGSRSIGRGSIVNVASVYSFIATPGLMSYVASKHAIMGLTKSAAIDNVKDDIRINAVCPAWVDTPMMQASLKRVPQLDQLIKTASPLHRAATVEEVADCIVFLSSSSASYVNGTGLVVDAGATLTAHVI